MLSLARKMTDFYIVLIIITIIKSHPGVISSPGIPGEKSLKLKQIFPPAGWCLEMTVNGYVISSICLLPDCKRLFRLHLPRSESVKLIEILPC